MGMGMGLGADKRRVGREGRCLDWGYWAEGDRQIRRGSYLSSDGKHNFFDVCFHSHFPIQFGRIRHNDTQNINSNSN